MFLKRKQNIKYLFQFYSFLNTCLKNNSSKHDFYFYSSNFQTSANKKQETKSIQNKPTLILLFYTYHDSLQIEKESSFY